MDYEVAIIGGGPAGSTAANILARNGVSVLLAERTLFPRFHIGESLLPKNMELFERLGVRAKLEAIPHTRKHGVELALGHEDESSFFEFSDCLGDAESLALNVSRAEFDQLLLDEAERVGADIRRNVAVRRIRRLGDNNVSLTVGAQEIECKYLVDASGQSTFLGRRLGTRVDLPNFRRVSYFSHFEGVARGAGVRNGFPTIVMMSDGWFWIIPLDDSRTSVGLVVSADQARSMDAPPPDILRLAISRCPLMTRRMATAQPVSETFVAADFSYRCDPLADEGYFLVGDAGAFLDPVFSTGVCLGMMGAERASEALVDILRRGVKPTSARAEYIKYVKSSSEILFRFVRDFYRHSCREILLREVGPLKVHRAIVTVLAGNVFPRPQLSLRWRHSLFNLFVFLQRWLTVAPRRQSVAIFDNQKRPATEVEKEADTGSV